MSRPPSIPCTGPLQPPEIRHLVRRSRDVEGWLLPSAAALLALLDEAQRLAGISGDLFEIGVHHGRSAVLLCAMARDGEQLGACDLFADQEANLSGSGSGDRSIFEANVRRIVPGFDRLRVFAKRSSDLTAAEVGRPVRLFHVDGGHLREEALNDLQLAAEVLHPAGAIVVDDPFRAEWPGVTEALLAFLAERREFAALLIGFNKLVLVRREGRAPYDSMLSAPETLWSYFDRRVYDTKTLPLAGEPVQILLIPTWRQRPALELAVARLLSLRSAAIDRARHGRLPAVRSRSAARGGAAPAAGQR